MLSIVKPAIDRGGGFELLAGSMVMREVVLGSFCRLIMRSENT
jgi:hypothetical protein